MTKLEELKAAADVLRRAGYAADAACEAAWFAHDNAYDAYEAELEKTQEEHYVALVEDLEDRYNYIQGVWHTLYVDNAKQLESVKAMAAQFKKLQTTDTGKYLDSLEEFVEFMEESSLYVKPNQTTAKE
jgi:hypothetical protein